jgi:hypothetical protein
MAHPVLTVEDYRGTPTLGLRVTCSGCGAVLADDVVDVTVTRDGDELAARHAAAWNGHVCPGAAA